MSPNQSLPITLTIRLGSVLAMAIAVLWSTAAQAQTSPNVQWVQTSFTDEAYRLFTPASGALLVRTKLGLARSDDGGISWSSVSLPPEPPVPTSGPGWPGHIVVDPTSHTTIYAASPHGIYKTEDDAANWRVILPPDPAVPEIGQLEVSPADHQTVYATLTNRELNQLRLVRSGDGGATWETVHSRETDTHVSCDWAVYLLQAHPTDPNRVFMAASCPRTSSYADVEQSTDRGATWTMFRKSGLATPDRLVAAGDTPPGQILIPLNKDYRGGGSLLTRTADDGATWTTLLEFSGGGGMSGGGPNVGMSSLAVDPTMPNRLLLGINASNAGKPRDSQIRLSTDAGSSWTEIAPTGFPPISEVAFGIDGKMMFATTKTGVWRTVAP